jgi:hypothetical protein
MGCSAGDGRPAIADGRRSSPLARGRRRRRASCSPFARSNDALRNHDLAIDGHFGVGGRSNSNTRNAID